MADDNIIDLTEKLKKLSETAPVAHSLGSSGGEPPWSPLDRRVARLEEDMGEVKQMLRELSPRIIETHAAMQPMRDDIAVLKTRTGELFKEASETRNGLSKDISDVKTEIFKVRTDLSRDISEVRTEVAEIKGLVKNIPSVTQTIIIVIAILGTTFASLSVLAFLQS
jgi:uncharacterized coiled-coil protein SlyX